MLARIAWVSYPQLNATASLKRCRLRGRSARAGGLSAAKCCGLIEASFFPSHFPADDPNQCLSRVDRAHDEHVAPMSLAADDMGEKPRQGTTPLSREVQTTFRSRKRSHTHHLVPDLSFGWDKDYCAVGTHFNGQTGGVNYL